MHFVIAGKINCPQFTYAVMVAQRLKENLPDFTYLKIPKKPGEWDRFLSEICKENDWYYIKSPLIWREISIKHGKKDFIGDINTFLDLCYDYYGIPPDVLSAEEFNKEEMSWFTRRTESEYFENTKSEAKKRRQYRSRQVCITGASSQMAEIIILELLQLDLQRREDGLEIRLFDQSRKVCQLMDISVDAKHCPGPSGFGNCRVTHNMKEAFSNVDMVIVLDCFPRKPKESIVKWLKRNRNAMCILGKALNKYAPQHCRVVIGSPSTQPICYNATVLASFATKLHVRNIVAVTQDLGRETLKFLSDKTRAPLKNFYCPPVWGFIGLNKYIDVRRTLQTNLYKVPGKRLNSTLPQGTAEYELRTTECLLSEYETDELLGMVSQHKLQTLSQLGKWPYFAKATAIIDLLKVWGLKQEDGNGEILCLGVYSDGTFNIPKGVYWSQPVILSNGFWVPFADFPIPRLPHFNAYYLFLFSIAALYRTKVKPRIYIPPKRTREPKKKNKFNLDKIIEGVEMPAIKTDTDCVSYLKYLCKKELGIDLDAEDEYIEEELESEKLPTVEAIREQIYCECWRQELKELQKIVFDRSSTTEVEVDLSDNISGSELTVINIPSDSGIYQNSSQKVVGDERTAVRYGSRMLLLTSTQLSSPPSTICSCEKLSTGSLCQCLGTPSAQEASSEVKSEEDKISTEHFYKEQNAEIFDEDLKDVIYADSYETAEKHVSFDSEAKQDDETIFQLKFYGRKDAVRDKDADSKMQKRISRYERGGEDSVEEEVEKLEEDKSTLGESLVDVSADRFQSSAEGTSLDVQPGIGSVQSKVSEKESSRILKEIDEVSPSTDIFPLRVKSSADVSDRNLFDLGEEQYSFGGSVKGLPEFAGEKTLEQYSLTTLEEDINMFWGEGGSVSAETETEKEGEDAMKKQDDQIQKLAKKRKRKMEGVPLCCLCRCLIPEGLSCCPCGSTTVVEVFKKESVEILIRSEDDISYAVEHFETILRPESEGLSKKPSTVEVERGEELTKTTNIDLPPESFLPFSPKPENTFQEAVRPYQLTKEYADSLKKPELEIPERCVELMEEAKKKLEEMELGMVEEEDQQIENKEEEDDDKENLPPMCEDLEQIKTDFSDLKLFLPCGLEDWRLTVQKKYRDWFFQGPKIKDDTCYDLVIEEVSEDEFEVDKELENYFET